MKSSQLICMADVTPKEVDWIWEPYIPNGMLTIIEGDPGIGKSWITLSIATCISRGEPLPFSNKIVAGNVLVLSAEEDPEYTQVPRLMKMGAELGCVYAIRRAFNLDPQGLDFLRSKINEVNAVIVFIDPLQCYLGSKDTNKATEMRSVLTPLSEIAHECACAVVVVRHFNKGSDKVIHRGAGSIDILAASRSVLAVAKSPRADNEGVMFHTKCNVGPHGDAISFSLENGKFEWKDRSNLTPEYCMGRKESEEELSAVEEAEEFIIDFLSDEPKSGKRLKELARANGISSRSIDRARRNLNIQKERTAEGWLCSLPGANSPTSP